MSLLRPSPGEVLDRLSIIGLKITAFQKAGKDKTKLAAEAHELIESLEELLIPVEAEILSTKLSEINRELWKAEDDVRSPSSTVLQIASTAQNITKLNDLRCSLIRQIDKACGVESIEEKIYA